MAIGVYGSIRSSDISINEIDAFYSLSTSRETNNNLFIRLTASDILEEMVLPVGDDLEVTGQDNLLEGMYNLTLPATIFNQVGIYTIFLRPKKTRLNIVDCGVLSALPSVKGIILDSADLTSDQSANNGLQGYRIEYINTDGTKVRNTPRFVVSSNKVVPITENIGNTSSKSVRYRFDDTGTLIFLQVTPASSSSVKPNVSPFIGNPNQTILISNTSMNPISIEVDMVENDINTVVDIVGGEQIKDVDNGIMTHYTTDENGDKQILKQFDLYEIKDNVGNVSLFEVKEERTTIDTSQDMDEITGSV
jgi:hypothetical protein